MRELEQFVASVQGYLWSFPMLFLLFGTHLYFTVRLKFIQRRIPEGIALSFPGKKKREARRGAPEAEKSLSPYSALATALAATIGTGNIVGIGVAVALGGPGAVFWCWLTGVFGIATCYAECFLSVKYRVKRPDGSLVGGPMYVLEHVLHKKGMAAAFATFTVLASFGIGSSVQSHSIRTAITEQIEISPHLIGIVAGVLAGIVVIGGSRQIAKVCTWLVPVMSLLYLGGCLFIILKNYSVVPEALSLIVNMAFRGKAAAGGVMGAGVMAGIRIGISRGLFTNEAGLGSIPMTAAAAKTTSPVKQGLVSMTGPFWDTVVMCAVTGIAVVSSMVGHTEKYAGVPGERICFVAFEEIPFCGSAILSVSLVLFAFATIIGWNVYGECAANYLWGVQGVKLYQVLYMLFIYFGSVISMNLVWGMSDLFNSLMAIPNLLGIWLLREQIIKETL